MGSYLGVPLRVGGTVYGHLHLHLVHRQGRRSSARDDEELVTTLPSAAAVAIGNALLLAACRRAQWQAAAAELSRFDSSARRRDAARTGQGPGLAPTDRSVISGGWAW